MAAPIVGGSEPWTVISVRTQSEDLFQFSSSPALQKAAVRWAQTVRSRKRWSDGRSRDLVAADSRAQLNDLGFTEGLLPKIADTGLVEIGISFTSEEVGWEARIFPWEYMLSAATQTLRNQRPLVVVRNLERTPHDTPSPVTPSRLLIVESAPKGLVGRQTSIDG